MLLVNPNFVLDEVEHHEFYKFFLTSNGKRR